MRHQQLLLGGDAAPFSAAYGWTLTGSSVAAGANSTVINGGKTYRHNCANNSDSANIKSVTAISGKTYCEFKCRIHPADIPKAFGVSEVPFGSSWFGTPNANGGYIVDGYGGCGSTPNGYVYNSTTRVTNTSYMFNIGDNIGIAFDPATRKVWFRLNGTWISGDPAAGTGETLVIPGGTVFYFCVSYYECLTPSGVYEADIYPSSALQAYAAPSGFSTYQP